MHRTQTQKRSLRRFIIRLFNTRHSNRTCRQLYDIISRRMKHIPFSFISICADKQEKTQERVNIYFAHTPKMYLTRFSLQR